MTSLLAGLTALLASAVVATPEPAPAAAGGSGPEARGAPQALPDHHDFTALLEAAVRMPKVDYREVRARRAELDRYLERLARVRPEELERAPREEQLALWLNAYNACMLKIVDDHYPIEPGGVGLFGWVRNRVAGYPDNSVWQIRDVFTRAHCRVAGAERSQDEIEHEIIRPRFEEPRIHFAVNCAALSCPVLWPEAYVAERLEEQLERAVWHFIGSAEHFRLERGPPAVLTVNKVLDWYADDFGGEEGILRFFAGYLEGADRERLLRPDTRVRFFEYDWTLNDVER